MIELVKFLKKYVGIFLILFVSYGYSVKILTSHFPCGAFLWIRLAIS